MLTHLVRFAILGADHGVPPDATLAPDMFPLLDQIMIAARFPLRGAYPLAGLPIPEQEPHDGTLRNVAVAVENYRQILRAIDVDRIAAAGIAEVRFRAGQADLTLASAPFVHQFILPNMYFHASMAYAILRAQGVPLGKGDFDGLHSYAPDFSFV